MTSQDRNYAQAVKDVSERMRQAQYHLSDAENAMEQRYPHEAWRLLNNAKEQIEGALVTAKWAQTIYPREEP